MENAEKQATAAIAALEAIENTSYEDLNASTWKVLRGSIGQVKAYIQEADGERQRKSKEQGPTRGLQQLGKYSHEKWIPNRKLGAGKPVRTSSKRSNGASLTPSIVRDRGHEKEAPDLSSYTQGGGKGGNGEDGERENSRRLQE